jgi:hypothetical protein
MPVIKVSCEESEKVQLISAKTLSELIEKSN